MLEAAAYLALAAGYLVAILSASDLTLLGFMLLTACNLAWAYVFRRMPYSSSNESDGGSKVESVGCSAAMVVLTLVCVQLVRVGIGFDWLFLLVTIGVFGVQLPPRVTVGLSVGLWLAVSISLLTLESGGISSLSQSELTLLPAAIFTFAFSFVVRQQYTERRRIEALVERLEEAQQQLRRYAGEVEELTVTRERNSMAREIHDTLGHYLTILAVKLETATKLEERGDQRLRDELLEARRVAGECLLEVRRSVSALRPVSLTTMRLHDALIHLVAEFEASSTETQATLDVEGPTETLGADVRLALYRATQEALTNIRKHAHATKVLVRLRVETRRVELLVRDNGVGSGAEGSEPGFGLQGMRERLALLGGEVAAGPDPDHGWRVEISLPLASGGAPVQEHGSGGNTAPGSVNVCSDRAVGREATRTSSVGI